MQEKFEINWKNIKIKGGCRSGRKKVTHNSNSDFPLLRWLFTGRRMVLHCKKNERKKFGVPSENPAK